jgi:hypothetical protein
MCRDDRRGVRWDGKSAPSFDLEETDERKAREKLLEQTSEYALAMLGSPFERQARKGGLIVVKNTI